MNKPTISAGCATPPDPHNAPIFWVRGQPLLPPKTGSRNALRKGEGKLIAAVNRALAKRGQDCPVVQQAMAELAALACGQRRLERFTVARIGAIRELLDRLEGKPLQRVEVSRPVSDHEYAATFEDGSEVYATEPGTNGNGHAASAPAPVVPASRTHGPH